MSRNRQAIVISLFGLLVIGMGATASLSAAPVQDGTKPAKTIAKSPQDAKPETAPPAAEHMPEADAIIDRYIESVGGEKAMKEFKFRTIKGEMSIPSQGINGTIEVHQAAPNFFLLVVDIPGFGKTMQGYNGEVAWSSDAMSGPRLLEGTELESAQRDGDFFSDLNYKTNYPKRETIGKEEYGDAMCWKVKLLTPSDSEFNAFYSLDTGLLMGMMGSVDTPQGKLDSVSHLTNYEETDGVKFARKNVVDIPAFNVSQVFTIKSINHDEFSKDIFDLPKAVQTLVDTKKDEKKDADKDADAKKDAPPAEPKHEE